jgi:uncharacterized protein (TIGR00369 family)
MGCPLLDELPHRSFDDNGTHVVELDITDSIRGPGGSVHGGVIASLIDRAGAYAVFQASQRFVATSSVAVSYLTAATVGPLRAIATPIRIGRKQAVAEVRVFDSGKDDVLVASALLTLSYLSGDTPQSTSS